MKTPILIWILRIVAAAIMIQTLYFKFTASEESVYIFSTLGVEPFGRISAGVGELIASILLLIPRTTILGALMGMGVMAGALLSHLTILGIEVKGDGGQLFALAIITFFSCAILVYLQREKIPQLLKFQLP
jgi:uncharacterized membrane protein YphA (DoxX/SURF4 family)